MLLRLDDFMETHSANDGIKVFLETELTQNIQIKWLRHKVWKQTLTAGGSQKCTWRQLVITPTRRFNSFGCCDFIMQLSSSMAVHYQEVGETLCLLKTAAHVHVRDNGGDFCLSRLPYSPQPTDTQTAVVRPGARVRSDRENNWTTNVNYVIHFNKIFHTWHVQSAPLRVSKALWFPHDWHLEDYQLPVHLKGSQVCFLLDCRWNTVVQYTAKPASWLNQGR